jgi:Protein of unknown function (DUF541)
VAGVWQALRETPAHRAMQVLEIDVDQRVVFERRAPRVNEAVECTPALAARVLSEAMALGVDEVEGIRCTVRDPSPQLEDLLVKAVDAARRKAEGLAQAAERPLGGIVAVEEQSRNAWTTTCARSSFVGAAATGSSKCSCTRPSCRQHRIRLTSAPG